MKKLGGRQRSILSTLNTFGHWPGGFVWSCYSDTKIILDSLVRRGLVNLTEKRYTITDAGRAVLEATP